MISIEIAKPDINKKKANFLVRYIDLKQNSIQQEKIKKIVFMFLSKGVKKFKNRPIKDVKIIPNINCDENMDKSKVLSL